MGKNSAGGFNNHPDSFSFYWLLGTEVFSRPINSEFSVDKIEKHEMNGACSACGEEERRIQDFGGETCGKETTWETQA